MRLAEGQSIVNFSKVAHEEPEEQAPEAEGTVPTEAQAEQSPAQAQAAEPTENE